jgi:hypothetical protein
MTKRGAGQGEQRGDERIWMALERRAEEDGLVEVSRFLV